MLWNWLSVCIMVAAVAAGMDEGGLGETHMNEECEVSAKKTDHLILEYSFWRDGELISSKQIPNQLQYVHLDGSTGSALESLLLGMCEQSTRTEKWVKGTASELSFGPLSRPSIEEDSVLELEITLRHVTSQWDFDIFEHYESGNVPKLLDFIEEHRGINAVDQWGQSSLMKATTMGTMQIIAGMLNTRRPRVDVNMAKSSGHTALHYAVQLKTIDTVRALLRRGADPDARLLADGAKGNTALHLACFLGNFKHAGILLEFGAAFHLENEHGQLPTAMIPRDATPSIKLEFRSIFYEAQHKVGGAEGDNHRAVHADSNGAYWRDV